MKNVIYKIEDNKGRIYIGSSVDSRKRKNAHFLALKKGLHSSKKMQNVYNKYGVDFLKFEIIEHVEDSSLLIEREQFYIDSLIPWYNSAKIAGSPLGVKHSEETKQLQSVQKIGKRIHSDEFKRNLAERNRNRVWTEEMKSKISIANSGVFVSVETREKISKAGKNRRLTVEHKERIGIANKGRECPIKTREAVSISNKRRALIKESIIENNLIKAKV